jgi:preprotein translocase subunit YajC
VFDAESVSIYVYAMPLLAYIYFLYFDLIRNEKKFVISGLEVAMQPTWHERQSAYVTAVKAMVVKLNIEPDAVEIKFCRSFRTKPKLFLDVECGSVAQ